MFGINVGRDAARLLRLGDDVQRKRRLAGGFRPEDFDDAAPRYAADADGGVERERGRRDRGNVNHLALAEAHDRAFAESLFDVCERRFDRLAAIRAHSVSHVCYHSFSSPFLTL